MKSTLLACLLALPILASPVVLAAATTEPVSPALRAAVADPRRPQADTQRDAERKPAESMAFAGVQPGMTIIELLPGGGYYTRLLSAAVGSKGHLYELVGAPRPDAPAGTPDRTLPIKAIIAEPGYGNITLLVQPLKELALPAGADLAWTSNNYHDVHNVAGIDLAAFNKAVYAALKPGGHYLVIDHAAAEQADAEVTSTLHRIRAATVIAEVQAAGFVLEEQGYALRNPGDSHELKVFDPKIQGKTDQFMLRFRKPR